MKKLLQHWKNLDRTIFTGAWKEKNIRSNLWLGLVIAAVGLVMAVLNYLQQGINAVFYITLVIFACGLLMALSAGIWKNRWAAYLFELVICVGAFTYFTVTGVNAGFAILWTLLAPAAVCYFINVKNGILLSVYYLILFAVLFYSPLRTQMTSYYSETFLTRFPLLYLCEVLVNALAMGHYHESMLYAIDAEKQMLRELREQMHMSELRADEYEKLSMQIVGTLADTIDAKDKYTNGHSFRVSEYAVMIAKELHWSDEDIQVLREEGLLHDIGKIGVPDSVLNKPGRLTDNEFRVIKSHTTIGGAILENINSLPGAALVARHHHERYDGRGYPDSLSGKSIPEHARMVAIADAYDAMRSDRIYRKGLPKEVIREELVKGRGFQFDPDFLDIFLRLFDEGRLDEIDAAGRIHEDFQNNSELDNTLMNRLEQEKKRIRNGSEAEVTSEDPEIAKLKSFYKEISREYMRGFEFLMVTVHTREDFISDDTQIEKAMGALDFVVRNSVEGHGVCTGYAENQILVLIYDAANINADLLLQKVYSDFFRMTDSGRFEMSFLDLTK